MRIGRHEFANRVFLAPMAGITDKPFRTLCRSLGAGHAIAEMVTSDPSLRHTRKSRTRSDHDGEPSPVHAQIAGSDPRLMADAARHNADLGADIIDINMGCPAKKVCNKLAGSSLLRDERLVAKILESVVEAVDVPVTLKTRTGWDAADRNIVNVGRIAEGAGVAAITLHGRARNDFYRGRAEHESMIALRGAVSLPLIANGDLTCAREAREVLDRTGADAVMIGRAAQSRPWLPGLIAAFLDKGIESDEPGPEQRRDILRRLVTELHAYHGDTLGVRIARKHISWQLACFSPDPAERRAILEAREPRRQLSLLDAFFQSRMNCVKAA
jgi:tRNA-dihydrouridine synthase B